jgi:hypothetical protein
MADESNKESFLSDIQELRRRARKHIEDGAVTGIRPTEQLSSSF